MIPYGVIGRTNPYFKLPIFTELTHHQLIVATALANEKALFFAGLFHDLLKSLLDFECNGKCMWKHLFDVGIEKVSIRDVLDNSENSLKSFFSENEIQKVIEIILNHHKRGEEGNNNPIRAVENRFSLPVVESTLLPSRSLHDYGLSVCLEARELNHPYHFFIFMNIFYGIRNIMDNYYSRLFRELGIDTIKVEYNFLNKKKLPEILYEDGQLTLHYFIPTRLFDGKRVLHVYSGIEFQDEKNNTTNPKRGKNKTNQPNYDLIINHRWSDILTFIVPAIYEKGLSYRVICVLPLSITGNTLGFNSVKVSIERLERDLRRKIKNEVIEKMLDDIFSTKNKKDQDTRSYISNNIMPYLEGEENGEYSCMFCGKKTNLREKNHLGVIIKKTFTDASRIDRSRGICPLCWIGYELEERFRKHKFVSFLALPSEVISVKISDDFEHPIFRERVELIQTMLGLSTLQLFSRLWYNVIFEKLGVNNQSRKKFPIWAEFFKVRKSNKIDEQKFKFFIGREIVLYPTIIKLRPRALFFGHRGKKKKFILNGDILNGNSLLFNTNLGLNEIHLDLLSKYLNKNEELVNNKKFRKIYERLVDLYAIREA